MLMLSHPSPVLIPPFCLPARMWGGMSGRKVGWGLYRVGVVMVRALIRAVRLVLIPPWPHALGGALTRSV